MGRPCVSPLLPTHVFRVTRDIYARDTATALSGTGGMMGDGRWNSKGRRIIYTSESATLCLFERVVHGDEWIAERHADRVMLKINVPPVGFIHFTADELAARDPNWQVEGNPFCRRLGDAWLHSRTSCALMVPSAANPVDYNILFNPEVAEFVEIIQANASIETSPLTPEDRVVSLVREFRKRGVK